MRGQGAQARVTESNNAALGPSYHKQVCKTNSQGVASRSFTPQQTGRWEVSATVGGVTSNTVQPNVIAVGVLVSPTTEPEGSPSTVASPVASVGNGQPTVSGDGVSSATPSTSVAGIGDIATQAETATGLGSNALLIILAVIIIVILAIIATALLVRWRGEG